ncbi:MAG: pantoate--beta-alanine ligase, partial [Deltaproteobacteria bacterium]|nr:pantoate--beta-alanine ligase [Deltaproteobacteria bacterium]
MEIFRTINPARQMARTWKARGQSVGVVPTMGFLHAGHESLIRRAMAENGQVLVTVFVNPTQFAPNEDLAAYPRDLGRDLAICESLGVGAVFCPEPGEMYPSGFATQVSLPSMSQVLCGRSRPHHFQGVCTV